MVNVSSALKQAFNPNNGEGARQIDYTVRFDALNEQAHKEAKPAAQEDISISRMHQVMNEVNSSLNIATFEQNGFALDGSTVVPPRTSEAPEAEIGLIMPDISDADGNYENPQLFSLPMETAQNILGVGINWGHYVPADYDVIWLNGTDKLHTYPVRDNQKSENAINHAETDVTNIQLRVYRSAQPKRHVRIAEVVLGAVLEYTRDNTESITLQEIIVPLSERTPTNSLKIVADNFERDFDIYNPGGIYAYFRERMKLYPKIGAMTEEGTFEYVDMGVYYLQAPKLKGNLSMLELEAVGALGTVTESVYTGGTYSASRSLGQSIYNVKEFSSLGVSWPSRLNGISINGYTPSITIARALQMIAQATNTLITPSRDKSIPVVIRSLDGAAHHMLGRNDYRMDAGITPEDEDPVNTVVVEYAQATIAEEATELGVFAYPGHPTNARFRADNAVLYGNAGEISVKYAPSTDQFWYRNGDNGDRAQIMGKLLSSTVGSVTRSFRAPGDPEYTYTVSGNPYITTPEMAASVAEYLLMRRGKKRRTTTINYRGYPYLEPGDVVRFGYGDNDLETQDHFITENTLTLSGGGMTGTLKAREL